MESAHSPGVAEVVLGAGAEPGGELLAVDVDLFVAFAPPSAVMVVWEQGDADELVSRFLDY